MHPIPSMYTLEALFAALSAWEGLLGAENVLLGTAALRPYGTDTSGLVRKVPAALRIDTEPLLQAVLRVAQHHRVAVYPLSTGHNWGYGSALPARDGSVLLDLSRMQRILHFDPELGVVSVEPGVTQGMLADFLEQGGHDFLVPVTGAGPTCSLLANALERGFGVTPYTDHFGAVTDLQAVLADGSLYRTALHEAGSEELARLFKWGIGPYSAGLFTQSGFGVVTRISIVLARRPACVKMCLFRLAHDELLAPAVLSIRSVLARLPGTVGGIQLMNQHRMLSMSAPYPHERAGTNGLLPPEVISSLGRHYQVSPWTGFATLYGTQRMVAAAQKEMRIALGPVASRLFFVTPQRTRQLARWARWLPGTKGRALQEWTATLMRSLELVAGRPNETVLPLAYWRSGQHPDHGALHPGADGCGLTWYAPLVPMRPGDVLNFVRMVHEITPRYGIEPLITLTSLSDRLFDSTVPLLFDRKDPAATAAAAACFDELLHSGKAQGWFPCRVGIDAMPALMEMQDSARSFHERLRRSLDPHDILAPGRYR
ncbi:FAD-binding oxidoreductase [Simplicispira psychrophila]|uniref:FAD-binding oxidoreductase n=1 Tax=Simplicispira psychrophila TaxID=80882 RepID=UPI000A92788F|nr:FAD-binding oxidoreductase [Simplicispira psychrophila]